MIPLFPAVDRTTKLFPKPTMDALRADLGGLNGEDGKSATPTDTATLLLLMNQIKLTVVELNLTL